MNTGVGLLRHQKALMVPETIQFMSCDMPGLSIVWQAPHRAIDSSKRSFTEGKGWNLMLPQQSMRAQVWFLVAVAASNEKRASIYQQGKDSMAI